MTYQEALAYLRSLTNFESAHQPQAMRDVKLDRMRSLCERLGNPQRRFRSILVAGTNGKGSTCAMIYAILRAANLRVGLYTSPDLGEARERIRVGQARQTRDGEPAHGADWITEEEFASLVSRVWSAIEGGADELPGGRPTYFEMLTAVAFLHFLERRVDVAVCEVGLGGRLDATNVLEPSVCVIAPIGRDHTDILGTELPDIAREKAGIIRPGVPVVSARQEAAVSAVLHDAASTKGCRLIEYGRHLFADIMEHGPEGLQLTLQGVRGRYEHLAVPLLGRHQAENAAVAVAAVEALSESGIPRSPVRSGLAKVYWPGRLEVVRDSPVVLLDGAHNVQAARALRAALEELWPQQPKHFVLGMSADKPAQAFGEVLCPIASTITCTRSRHPRARDPQELAKQLGSCQAEVTVIPDAIDAYTYRLNTAKPGELIVITGSLFLVGELRAILKRPHRRRGGARSSSPRPVETSEPRLAGCAQQGADQCP